MRSSFSSAHRALPAALEQLREAVPALLGRVERVERAHRLLVDRLELEDALVVPDRLRPIAGDLLGDERDLGEQLRAATPRPSSPSTTRS